MENRQHRLVFIQKTVLLTFLFMNFDFLFNFFFSERVGDISHGHFIDRRKEWMHCTKECTITNLLFPVYRCNYNTIIYYCKLKIISVFLSLVSLNTKKMYKIYIIFMFPHLERKGNIELTWHREFELPLCHSTTVPFNSF